MATREWILKFSLVAMTAIACTGTAHAAEKIRYDEIPKRLAPFGTVLTYRGFTVATADGKRYRGRSVRLDADQIRVYQTENSFLDLASVLVTRIEIRQSGRFMHHILIPAQIPLLGREICNGTGYDRDLVCRLSLGAFLSPVWAYTAATAPFFLAADAVAFLIPKKVYEIIP